MNLTDSYRILQVERSASMDDIKSSFRRLAMKLHPDLNPNDPQAQRRFQQVNEAYMVVRRNLENGGQKHGATDPGRARKAYQRQQTSHDRPNWQRESANSANSAGSGGAGGQRAKRPNEGSHKFNSGKNWKSGFWSWDKEHRKTSGKDKWGRPQPGSAGFRAQQQTQQSQQSQQGNQWHDGGGEHWYERKEDVLGDILRDPFAREVFEEIADQLRRQANFGNTHGDEAGQHHPSQPHPKANGVHDAPNPAPPSGHSAEGRKQKSGFFSRLSHKQLDVHETIHWPAAELMPGRNVRLTLKSGVLGKKRTLDVRLPPDFAVGKPVRLRGLGRKLMGKKGDLYLRILPQ